MFLTSIIVLLLLHVSTVFGDFEQFIDRNYTIANKVRDTFNVMNDLIRQDDYHGLNGLLDELRFEYTDWEVERRDAHWFVGQLLLRHTDPSKPTEFLDVHDIFEKKVIADKKGLCGQEIDKSHVIAEVFWNGRNCEFKFDHYERQNEFELIKVNCFLKKTRFRNPPLIRLVNIITPKIIKKEIVLAPGFVYETCDNQKIDNLEDLIARRFTGHRYLVDDAIQYKTTEWRKESCGLFGSKDVAYYSYFVQFEVVVLPERTIYLFEFDKQTDKGGSTTPHLNF